jgi:hypothetical protein
MIVLLVVPVIHPLPHVPQHVVQPESVGTLLSHHKRLTPAVDDVPRNLIDWPISLRSAPAPRRIFPFRFSGKSPSRPGAVVVCVISAGVHH